MLSDKDLVLIEYNKRVERLLKGQTQKSLVDFVSQWLNIPELQPNDRSTTIDDYNDPQLSKQTVVDRIMTHDWPKGLYAFQLAQLETKAFITSKRNRRWKVGRLLKNKGKLRLDLTVSDVERLFLQFLSPIFSCHLYTTHNKESDLYWMRIEVYATHTIETQGTGFLIFYPQTEFVLMTGKWDTTVERYINEAILHTFEADRLLTQRMKGDALKYLKHVIKTKRSQGVFAQLRQNQVDSNPLDIRQKAPLSSNDVEGEQKRRIKPLDNTADLSEARYKTVMETFGWDHIYGTTSLNIHVAVPIMGEDGQKLTEKIEFTVAMKGDSIPLGIKDMVKRGQVDMPAPSWLLDIASTGKEDIYITEDGVKEDEEMDEQAVEMEEEDTEEDMDEQEHVEEEEDEEDVEKQKEEE